MSFNSASLKHAITVSRPRFWLYAAGPYLVGVAASGILRELNYMTSASQITFYSLLIILGLAYFLFPANLLIYGLNDIADGDTDKYNPKKQSYEQQHQGSETTRLLVQIAVTTIITIGLIAVVIYFGLENSSIVTWQLIAAWLLFVATSAAYSLPPIRAKAKPFLDGISNVLYIIPGLVGYFLFGGTIESVLWLGFLGGWFWSIAMHTFSAIPDIKPDQEAGLLTTAVLLGKKNTILYCLLLRAIATLCAIFALPYLIRFFVISFLVYATLLHRARYGSVFAIYKKFPLINGIIGFILFRLIMIVQLF